MTEQDTEQERHNLVTRMDAAGRGHEEQARQMPPSQEGYALLALVEVIRAATLEVAQALTLPPPVYEAGPVHVFNGPLEPRDVAVEVDRQVRPTRFGLPLEQVDERAIVGVESLADTYGLAGITAVAENLLALGSIEHYCHRTKRVEDGNNIECGCRPT